MKTKIIVLLMLYHVVEGAYFSPIAYTLPNGLQSVNGSSSTGGCQPESCIMMPIGGSTINGCDCPGNLLVSGVLIDGVIPSINTQNGTWARELFTVNRNGQDSIMIGFEFSSVFYLREIEIVLFQCPILGIGITGVKIYSSFLFPAFVSAASTLLATLSFSSSDNCQSLSTPSIPIQPPMASSNIYFIKFLFTGGSSMHQLNWLYLGEMGFSDEVPTSNTPMTQPEVTSNPKISITSECSTAATLIPISVTASTISDGSDKVTIAADHDAIPVSIIVGTLVGVILLLILLILVGVGLISCFIFYKKRHILNLQVRKFIATENATADSIHELDTKILYSEENRASVAINSHYRQATEFILPDPPASDNSPPVIPSSPESDLYSEIRDVSEKGRSKSAPANASSGLYDAIPETEGTYTVTRSRRSSCGSGPIPLSKPLCEAMEDNPTYDTSGSLLQAFISHREDIYTDLDARFQGDTHQAIYEAVYSDASVQPSIFKKQVEQERSDEAKKETEQTATEENSEDKDDEEKVKMYAPIYILNEASPQPKREPLSVTNDNIHGVKILGTGFFGKVVLADTVGLSLKDLGLSKTDDDKSISIQVAVKKLKANVSKTTQEAFEKEYKFMSRLDHPNVIRMLGLCNTGPTQFIMMEYMERGDLNNYLRKFETIVGEGTPKEKEIPVGTLVYMCTQIASAMKYLIMCNFIHRDLAARNCLIGDDNLIKLADFGMSRSLYESHYYIIQGQAVLPVRWMATECFYGKFSAKTDVWAFGVTMWEIFMLAKERPYSDMEDMEVVDDAIEKEERTLLSQPDHCPDDVFQVTLSCWAKEPKDRATFDELYSALSKLSIKSVDDSTI